MMMMVVVVVEVVVVMMMARAGGSAVSPRDHVTTPRAETMHPDLAHLRNQALLNHQLLSLDKNILLHISNNNPTFYYDECFWVVPFHY